MRPRASRSVPPRTVDRFGGGCKLLLVLPSALAAVPTGTKGAGWLGKYQLIRRLAAGGMAELFLARTSAIHGFEKSVVLKRILPSTRRATTSSGCSWPRPSSPRPCTIPISSRSMTSGKITGRTSSRWSTCRASGPASSLVRARLARSRLAIAARTHSARRSWGSAAGLNHAHEKVGLDGKPARHRSPRRIALQRPRDVRGRREDCRLRYREGGDGSGRDDRRHAQGQDSIHVPGAVSGRGRSIVAATSSRSARCCGS